MRSNRLRNPRALSSALIMLGTVWPRTLGFLNPVDSMDTTSNLYLGPAGHTKSMRLAGNNKTVFNKPDISYLKASWAFYVLIHSRALLAAILCWLVTL